MKQCKKISITFPFRDKSISLSFGEDDYGVSNLENGGGDKIFPKFPYVCVETDEPLSDEILDTLKKEIAYLLMSNRQLLIDNGIPNYQINQIMTAANKLSTEAIIANMGVVLLDADSSDCGDGCEPVDDEEDPELPPIVPEDEENIFESLENQCYEGSVDITYTLDGETKTETYRFYYTGDGENVPESPTLETINDYFSNYRGTNLPPDWLDIEGATITTVEPKLLGQVFWFPVNNGCDNEPPSEPEPNDPVPAPPPSPPPSPPPAPQPKPDKVINIELEGCPDASGNSKVTANVSLYSSYLTGIMKTVYSQISKNLLENRDVFRKFTPNNNAQSKSNKDSIIWIGSTQNSSMTNSSSVRVIVIDNQWGIELRNSGNNVQLPMGFRFNFGLQLITKFDATLKVKCGDKTRDVPIFFGHSFVDNIKIKNTKNVTFTRVGNTNRYILSNPDTLFTVLRDLLTSPTLDITSSIIINNNGKLEYRDSYGQAIANSLKGTVIQVINDSKEQSKCEDCCLVSISDIRVAVDAGFSIVDITSPGGDSIYKPELRDGETK